MAARRRGSAPISCAISTRSAAPNIRCMLHRIPLPQRAQRLPRNAAASRSPPPASPPSHSASLRAYAAALIGGLLALKIVQLSARGAVGDHAGGFLISCGVAKQRNYFPMSIDNREVFLYDDQEIDNREGQMGNEIRETVAETQERTSGQSRRTCGGAQCVRGGCWPAILFACSYCAARDWRGSCDGG